MPCLLSKHALPIHITHTHTHTHTHARAHTHAPSPSPATLPTHLQFIYDTWYAHISPDVEFPAEIRRLLNHAFGQLARRARRLDLRAAMVDLSELLMEQVGGCGFWVGRGGEAHHA
jgi:hypothetical protein